MTHKIVDNGRKLKSDMKNKKSSLLKSARMSKNYSEYCEGTMGI